MTWCFPCGGKELLMSFHRTGWVLFGLSCLVVGLATSAVNASSQSRTFEFTYQATVTGLEAGKKVRLWAPVPASSDDQDVRLISREVIGKNKVEGKISSEQRYGNRCLFAEVEAS